MIRDLRCDEYARAGHISKASPEVPSRSTSADPKKIEPPARRKKIFNKRLPVTYFPDLATFPRISFLEYKPD
jgi:hypothetical protein